MTVKLNFSQILPKELVHKWSIDQVLLTDYAAMSPTHMVLGAQLPRSHGLYSEHLVGGRSPDIAALVEMCRQSCFVVAHKGFDVPLVGNEYQFLFQELDSELIIPPARIVDRAEVLRPLNIRLDCKIERNWHRGSRLSGLAWHFHLSSENGGEMIGRVRIRQMWIERCQWRKMRAMMRRDRGLPDATEMTLPPPSSLMPSTVGRVNPVNVLLAQVMTTREGFEAIARIDIRHPVLFDHSIDHIYAMVQTEAARQLALYASATHLGVLAERLEVCRCIAKFESVGEFDLETRLVAQVGHSNNEATPTTVTIALMQRERRLSTFQIDVRTSSY